MICMIRESEQNGTKQSTSTGAIAVSRVKPLSARLLFIKPIVEDSGTYKCVVNVSNEAAEFIDVELEQHPEEGEDAEIVCRVRGDPSLEIFWQFEGKTILE
ncbi:unnamed protein product, partial [Acanthocheilonema viteae]